MLYRFNKPFCRTSNLTLADLERIYTHYIGLGVTPHLARFWAEELTNLVEGIDPNTPELSDDESEYFSASSSVSSVPTEPFPLLPGPIRYITFYTHDPHFVFSLREDRPALVHLNHIDHLLRLRRSPDRILAIVGHLRQLEQILNPNPDIVIVRVRAQRPPHHQLD